jgi:isoleucyl-tRNA synthetase
VTIYASAEVASVLEKLDDELRFVLITSTATVSTMESKPADTDTLSVNGHDFAVLSSKASGEKCVRCWHLRDDVGSDEQYPEVCSRCISNVHGQGEQRAIA